MIELCKKHAKRDAEGNPITVNNNFDIADKLVFDKDIHMLKSEYKPTLELIDQKKIFLQELLFNSDLEIITPIEIEGATDLKVVE